MSVLIHTESHGSNNMQIGRHLQAFDESRDHAMGPITWMERGVCGPRQRREGQPGMKKRNEFMVHEINFVPEVHLVSVTKKDKVPVGIKYELCRFKDLRANDVTVRECPWAPGDGSVCVRVCVEVGWVGGGTVVALPLHLFMSLIFCLICSDQ